MEIIHEGDERLEFLILLLEEEPLDVTQICSALYQEYDWGGYTSMRMTDIVSSLIGILNRSRKIVYDSKIHKWVKL